MFRASLVIATMLGLIVPSAHADELKSIEVDGTAFVVTFADGRLLRSPDLVGATLAIATSQGVIGVRIDAVERDPDAVEGPIWLHSFSIQTADGSWMTMCDPGPDGRRQGFPLAGRPGADGTLEAAEPGTFELVCTAGARGKCVRFGYLPWRDAAMRDLYNSCGHMVRADYCGDDSPTTRDGTRIDIYDDRGIQKPDNDPADMFEAGWTANGAVCVRHARVKENISLPYLVEVCPRLKERVGEMCTEAKARELGAQLFNRSRP
jgi:hypothetical protein